VTATPGTGTCTTAGTSCQITGLTNGTSYTFTVKATNAIGDSLPSAPSSAITPRLAINYNVIFNSNGGTSVGNSSFVENGTLSAPTDPTRNGFNFIGWATTDGNESTIISFPYSPSNADLTLYAIWRASNPALNPDNSGNNGAVITPISTKASATPKATATPKTSATAKPSSTAKPTASATASPEPSQSPSQAPTSTPKPTQPTDTASEETSGSGFDNLILGLMALLGAFLTAGLGVFAARVMRKSKK
jgi:titin